MNVRKTPNRVHHLRTSLLGVLCLQGLLMLQAAADDQQELRDKIGQFEQGLSSRDLALALQPFSQEVMWQGLWTYDYVKENITELFQIYSSMALTRTKLSFSSWEGRINSVAAYRLQAVRAEGDPVELAVSFYFLWENDGREWKIIATNVPRLTPYTGSVADELKALQQASTATGKPGQPDAGSPKIPPNFDLAVADLCARDEAFVRSLYHCILNREATRTEQQNQVQRLQSGLSRQDLVGLIFSSPEYTDQRHGGQRFMTDVYQTLFARQPHPTEIESWPRTHRSTILTSLFKNQEHLSATYDCEAQWRRQPAPTPRGGSRFFTGDTIIQGHDEILTAP